MNSLKSLAMNCGPLSEMIRGRASGYFSFAPCKMISMSASVIASRMSRLVKIFMRRDCSSGVGRQDVLDSGCHVADRAQAEQGRGRAARCSCLDGCVLRDNALGTG